MNEAEESYECENDPDDFATRIRNRRSYKERRIDLYTDKSYLFLQGLVSGKKLLYPTNVARNVGRLGARTFFVLTSDIELYPNPGLSHSFLAMVRREGLDFRELVDKPR